RATDAGGNEGDWFGIANIDIDVIPPQFSINTIQYETDGVLRDLLGADNDIAGTGSITITGAYAQGPASIKAVSSFDADASRHEEIIVEPSTDAGTFTIANLPLFDTATAGANTITLTATDDVGNVQTITRAITLDRIGPDIQVTTSPDAPEHGDPLDFAVTATDTKYLSDLPDQQQIASMKVQILCRDTPEYAVGCDYDANPQNPRVFDMQYLDGTWSAQVIPQEIISDSGYYDLHPANYKARIIATDAFGNTNTKDVDFVIRDTHGPTITVTIDTPYSIDPGTPADPDDDIFKVIRGASYPVHLEFSEYATMLTTPAPGFRLKSGGATYPLTPDTTGGTTTGATMGKDYTIADTQLFYPAFDNKDGVNSEFVLQARDVWGSLSTSVIRKDFIIDTQGPGVPRIVPDLPASPSASLRRIYTNKDEFNATGFLFDWSNARVGGQSLRAVLTGAQTDTESATSASFSDVDPDAPDVAIVSVLPEDPTVYRVPVGSNSFKVIGATSPLFEPNRYVQIGADVLSGDGPAQGIRSDFQRYRIISITSVSPTDGTRTITIDPPLETTLGNSDEIYAFDRPVPTGWFQFTIPLVLGEQQLRLKALDEVNIESLNPTTYAIVYDTEVPAGRVDFPEANYAGTTLHNITINFTDDHAIDATTVLVTLTSGDDVRELTCADLTCVLGADGKSILIRLMPVTLPPGDWNVKAEIKDKAENQASVQRDFILYVQPQAPVFTFPPQTMYVGSHSIYGATNLGTGWGHDTIQMAGRDPDHLAGYTVEIRMAQQSVNPAVTTGTTTPGWFMQQDSVTAQAPTTTASATVEGDGASHASWTQSTVQFAPYAAVSGCVDFGQQRRNGLFYSINGAAQAIGTSGEFGQIALHQMLEFPVAHQAPVTFTDSCEPQGWFGWAVGYPDNLPDGTYYYYARTTRQVTPAVNVQGPWSAERVLVVDHVPPVIDTFGPTDKTVMVEQVGAISFHVFDGISGINWSTLYFNLTWIRRDEVTGEYHSQLYVLGPDDVQITPLSDALGSGYDVRMTEGGPFDGATLPYGHYDVRVEVNDSATNNRSVAWSFDRSEKVQPIPRVYVDPGQKFYEGYYANSTSPRLIFHSRRLPITTEYHVEQVTISDGYNEPQVYSADAMGRLNSTAMNLDLHDLAPGEYQVQVHSHSLLDAGNDLWNELGTHAFLLDIDDTPPTATMDWLRPVNHLNAVPIAGTYTEEDITPTENIWYVEIKNSNPLNPAVVAARNLTSVSQGRFSGTIDLYHQSLNTAPGARDFLLTVCNKGGRCEVTQQSILYEKILPTASISGVCPADAAADAQRTDCTLPLPVWSTQETMRLWLKAEDLGAFKSGIASVEWCARDCAAADDGAGTGGSAAP
ncbi:hypothetical protein COV94_02595, partial [Candidatus Woesearchaeota archaeon CG11_big_fil_rev_8_21_14_0_20_57_5]